MQGIEYAVRKKSFPKIEDVGSMNINLGGRGLIVRARIAIDPNLPHTTLLPLGIQATIDELHLDVVETHHPRIMKTFGKQMDKLLKRRIEQVDASVCG